MNRTSVVVFGEALVDIFKADIVVGGAPFNVARHLAGFGQSTHFVTAIGQDNAADLIKQEFYKFNLSDKGVQVLPQFKTGSVQVHEAEHGHTFEIMSNCAYDHIQVSAAINGIASFNEANKSSTKNIFYHGSLSIRSSDSFDTFTKVTEFLKKSDSDFYFDINWREGFLSHEVVKALIQQADYIKLSAEELEMVLDWFYLEHNHAVALPTVGKKNLAINKLLKKLVAKYLFVTYGELGSAVFDFEGRCVASAPTSAASAVIDTVGAGDAFSSVILLALTHGWELGLTLERANKFAAAVCCIRGAVPLDVQFYKEFITDWSSATALA